MTGKLLLWTTSKKFQDLIKVENVVSYCKFGFYIIREYRQNEILLSQRFWTTDGFSNTKKEAILYTDVKAAAEDINKIKNLINDGQILSTIKECKINKHKTIKMYVLGKVA